MKIPSIQDYSYSGTWQGPTIHADLGSLFSTISKINSSRWAVAFFALGAFISYKGFSWFKLKRLIENMPTSTVRGMAMGLVEISGRVKVNGEDYFESPISKKKCIFYLHIIEGYMEVREKGKRYKRWVMLATESKFAPYFCVEDSTGEALVKTEGSKGINRVRSIKEEEYIYGLGPDPDTVKGMLSQNKVMRWNAGSLDRVEKFRHYEFTLKPGDTVYVMGAAGKNPFVEDGSAKTSAENIMLLRGRDKILYISDKQERDLVKKLHRGSIIALCVGPVLMIICFTIILIKWGLL